MNSSTLFRTVSAGAILGCLALAPVAASAQPAARLDGYCYVRQTDMQRNSSVDSYGVRRAQARCYNGTYYAYSGESYAAPAAPDGYQVAYYTRRPDTAYYSRVVDAGTQYEASRSYGSSTYTGGDRYATTSSYGSSAYGSTAYGDDRAQPGYTGGADAYDDSRDTDRAYADDRDYQGDDRDYRSDDRYAGGEGGTDRDYSRHFAVEGWRDDSGQWHLGRPRAVGWQDESGRWHVGAIDTYGWRDARGQWHETREDDKDSADTRYGSY